MSGGMDGLDRARYHRVLSPVAFISFLLVINFPGNFRGPPFFFFLCWWVLEYLGISFFPLSNPAEVALLVGEISVFMSELMPFLILFLVLLRDLFGFCRITALVGSCLSSYFFLLFLADGLIS